MRHPKPSEDYSKFSTDTGEQIHDDRGREIPSPLPMAPPVGFVRQPSLSEQIRAMVRSEKLRQEAEAAGAETFEEADDFDIGDDFEPSSPYEANFDPMTPAERAALESQGRDVDRILGPVPKPKKEKSSADQADTDTEAAKPPKSGPAD